MGGALTMRGYAASFFRNVVGALMGDPLGFHFFPELSKQLVVGSPDEEGPFRCLTTLRAAPA